MITEIPLSQSTIALLDAYSQKLISDPDKYIKEDKDTRTITPGNIKYDPCIPGVSPDFFQTRDLNDVAWDNNPVRLHTCVYKHLDDIALPSAETQIALIEDLEEKTGLTYLKTRGHFLYPPNGYMGWHTNADVPGTRIYVTYVKEGGHSSFTYIDRWTDPSNPTAVRSVDRSGWMARMFTISNNPADYLWHCVNTEVYRISIGFMFG